MLLLPDVDVLEYPLLTTPQLHAVYLSPSPSLCTSAVIAASALKYKKDGILYVNTSGMDGWMWKYVLKWLDDCIEIEHNLVVVLLLLLLLRSLAW